MSRHHRAAKWSTHSPGHRERIKATLPARCVECGRPVTKDQEWDVAHITALGLGGSAQTVGPAHRSCNRKAGGRLGAALTNAKRRAPKTLNTLDVRTVKW